MLVMERSKRFDSPSEFESLRRVADGFRDFGFFSTILQSSLSIHYCLVNATLGAALWEEFRKIGINDEKPVRGRDVNGRQTPQSSSKQHEYNRYDYDVIIVGAGLTGLNAAHEITKMAPGARVKLLEVRDQVGGRIRARTMRTAEGDVWLDTGSHSYHQLRQHSPLLPASSDYLSFLRPTAELEHLTFERKRLSESESLTTRRSFRDVINSTEVSSWASRNVHDYLLSTGQTKPTMDTANRLLQTLFDSPDKSVSIIHLLLAAASENATVADLLSRYGHGQALFMQGGLNRLTRAMAEKLDVQLNQTVTSIEEGDILISEEPIEHKFQRNSVVTVKTPTDSYTARQVIVTAPPVVASTIQFTPPLEPQFTQFLERYRPSGRAYYFTMTFASPFWRGKGMSGQVIYVDFFDSTIIAVRKSAGKYSLRFLISLGNLMIG
ncbi:FAD dependent oxidoreductase [Cooperia oncophora]